MRTCRLLAFLACAGLAAGGTARALEPAKPSQLVTLLSESSCPFATTDAYGPRVNANGTTVNFVIPNGQVLVVTDITAVRSGMMPGDTVQVQILIGTKVHFVPVFYENVTVGASGGVTLQTTFPNGFVVKPGVSVCPIVLDLTSSNRNFAAGGTLHGFLAVDQ